MSQDHSFQVSTKYRITMHKNQFMLLLNDMKRKFLACFYPLQVLRNTSFVCTINWFSSFFFLFFLLQINVIYLGYFSKMKEIMNVNRRIILVSKICYDKIDDNGQLCDSVKPKLLTLIFVKGVLYMILHIWQAFRLSGTTFVRKVCMKFEYVWKPVFCEHNLPVEATYIHVKKLGRKGLMTCFTKIHIFLLLLGQIRWGLHWIVER